MNYTSCAAIVNDDRHILAIISANTIKILANDIFGTIKDYKYIDGNRFGYSAIFIEDDENNRWIVIDEWNNVNIEAILAEYKTDYDNKTLSDDMVIVYDYFNNKHEFDISKPEDISDNIQGSSYCQLIMDCSETNNISRPDNILLKTFYYMILPHTYGVTTKPECGIVPRVIIKNAPCRIINSIANIYEFIKKVYGPKIFKDWFAVTDMFMNDAWDGLYVSMDFRPHCKRFKLPIIIIDDHGIPTESVVNNPEYFKIDRGVTNYSKAKNTIYQEVLKYVVGHSAEVVLDCSSFKAVNGKPPVAEDYLQWALELAMQYAISLCRSQKSCKAIM